MLQKLNRFYREKFLIQWHKYRKSPIKGMIVPVVMAAPAAFVSYSLLHDKFTEAVAAQALYDFFQARPYVVLFFTLWPLFGIPFFRLIGWWNDKNWDLLRPYDKLETNVLIESIERLVEKKLVVFTHACNEIADKKANGFSVDSAEVKVSRKKVFNVHSQMAEISLNIHNVFTTLARRTFNHNDAIIRVFFAVVEQTGTSTLGKPEYATRAFVYPNPSDGGPKRNIEYFEAPNCTINIAARRGRTFVIENIARTDKSIYNFHLEDPEREVGDRGSLICYPIFNQLYFPDELPYVVCIHSSKPATFFESSNSIEQYDKILAPFRTRIVLELKRLEMSNVLGLV